MCGEVESGKVEREVSGTRLFSRAYVVEQALEARDYLQAKRDTRGCDGLG